MPGRGNYDDWKIELKVTFGVVVIILLVGILGVVGSMSSGKTASDGCNCGSICRTGTLEGH